jgi:hypothetical protein
MKSPTKVGLSFFVVLGTFLAFLHILWAGNVRNTRFCDAKKDLFSWLAEEKRGESKLGRNAQKENCFLGKITEEKKKKPLDFPMLNDYNIYDTSISGSLYTFEKTGCKTCAEKGRLALLEKLKNLRKNAGNFRRKNHEKQEALVCSCFGSSALRLHRRSVHDGCQCRGGCYHL